MWKQVSNLVFKFYDNPTVNESNIIVLMGQVLVYVGKIEHCARDIALSTYIILKIPMVGM